MTPEQRHLEDGLILFSVKDKDLLGYNNQYIGEAFMNFEDIEETSKPISSLPQVHLQLGRPTDLSKLFLNLFIFSSIIYNRLRKVYSGILIIIRVNVYIQFTGISVLF